MERVYRRAGRNYFVLSAVAALLVACNDEPPMAVNKGAESLEPAFAATTRGRIAFASNRSGINEVYVMNADGTGITKFGLSGTATAMRDPVLSPDGSEILFSSDVDLPGTFNLVAMKTDGSGRRRITVGNSNHYSPVWSPDGKRVAFASDELDNDEIFVRNADNDGTSSKNVTASPGNDIPGSWGTAGIFFESTRDGDPEIYRMNPDGTAVTRLTTSAGADARPRIAPRGKQILFESMRDGNLEVYVMNADGTNPVRLTNSAGKDYMASWSANGKKVVFVSDRAGGEHLWMMNLDGTGLTQLTSGAGSDSSPSYQR